MSTYEAERPDVAAVIEQGYGYVIVRRVVGEPEFTEGPADLSDTPQVEVEEGYVKATVHDSGDGAPVGVYELDGDTYTAPIGNLRPNRPRSVGLLV